MRLKNRCVVIALGGNAITRPGVPDTIANQFRHTRESLPPIISMARDGYRMVITHGNGPQVGNALLRVELARDRAPDLPLGVLVADTEGGIGYMIEQSLQNGLFKENIERDVVTIVTQTLVDKHDPSVSDPNKFVGQFFTEEDAERLSKELGWVMKMDKGRGWRRVVPSPNPLKIVNSKIIKTLVDMGVIVIAGGGGGAPVFYEDDGRLEGMDAVIDKDRASAVLGLEIGADTLMILTDADGVYLDFATPQQRILRTMTMEEAKEHLANGQFPKGSMGPKIGSAIHFLEGGGEKVIISSIAEGHLALKGEAGTTIT
ncbi:MAG: carbamate kinase [Candidatus Thermoplasmatota archaeon]|nr:carbamate kinase [Candidatus Thermoplasmatota archaeon]